MWLALPSVFVTALLYHSGTKKARLCRTLSQADPAKV
jgi:hypothetical protein